MCATETRGLFSSVHNMFINNVRTSPLALPVQSGVSSLSTMASSPLLPGIQGCTASTHRATGFELAGPFWISGAPSVTIASH